jgi:dipeptidyl aminopeptidase/acylaminoacyl peptidase
VRCVSVAILVSLALVGCTGESDDGGKGTQATSDRASRFEAPEFAAGSVLFVRKTSLRLWDEEQGQEKEIADLGSADAATSPDGAVVAFVRSTGGGHQDFIEEPELVLLELATGDETEAGPGLSPTFSDSGGLLAYLQPVGERRCEGEVCSGETRVMMGPVGEQADEVAPPGRWVSLGWLGDRLMIVDQNDPVGLKLASTEAEPAELSLAPSSVWGGSPSGDRILLIAANSAEFRPVEGTNVGAKSTLVALQGNLGQGDWSPDGSQVAGVLVGEPKGGIPLTELVTVSSEERPGGRVQSVEGSEGAAGQALWSSDGDSLVYARSAPPRGLNLEAIRCSQPSAGACRRLFSWPKGVLLLHLY